MAACCSFRAAFCAANASACCCNSAWLAAACTLVSCTAACADCASCRSSPVNRTHCATSWFCALVVPCTSHARPGIKAAMDISFLRAFKAPCSCWTSVVSFNRTTTLLPSDVFMVIWLPARLMMTPLTFKDCAKATLLIHSVTTNRIANAPIAVFNFTFVFIKIFLPLLAVDAGCGQPACWRIGGPGSYRGNLPQGLRFAAQDSQHLALKVLKVRYSKY